MSVEVGQLAPEFSLKDQNGQVVSLSDYRGKNVVLMFFPFAFTCSSTAAAIGCSSTSWWSRFPASPGATSTHDDADAA